MGLFMRSERDDDTAESAQQMFYREAIAGLLHHIREFSLDLTAIGSEKFKGQIAELTEAFEQESRLSRLRSAFETNQERIHDYIERERVYFSERDAEFANIIDLLTSGLSALHSDNEDFQSTLMSQTQSFETISQLDDLRQIKSKIANQVREVRRSIQDKQTRDESERRVLLAKVDTLEADFTRAEKASLTDALTGALNRMAFDQEIGRLIERNDQRPTTASLMMLDIDNFKSINDTYGHPVGDRVLVALVQSCMNNIRSNDIFARYGGEEFVLILPKENLRAAHKKARKLCKEVAKKHYALAGDKSGPIIKFTVSIGVTELSAGDTVASLVERADRALYEAKDQGKNRAVMAR